MFLKVIDLFENITNVRFSMKKYMHQNISHLLTNLHIYYVIIVLVGPLYNDNVTQQLYPRLVGFQRFKRCLSD